MRSIRYAVYGILFILILALNIHLRMSVVNMGRLKDPAYSSVRAEIYENITNQSKDELKDLRPSARTKIIVKRYEKAMEDPSVQARALEKYNEFKNIYQDENGNAYFLELDPYHWYRYTELVLKNGYHGDSIVDGQAHDDRMFYPVGMPSHAQAFMFYSTVYLYKLYNAVFPDVSLDRFVFYIPLLHVALMLIVIFVVCSYFFDIPTALVVTFIAGMAPITVSRGSAGWYDKDILSITFPLVIAALAGIAINRRLIVNILLSVLAGALTGLFAYTWHGWAFIFILVIAAVLYELLNGFSLYQDRELRDKVISCVSLLFFYFTSFYVFYLLFMRDEPFWLLMRYVQLGSWLGNSAMENVWPNTFFTVAELRRATLDSLQNNTYNIVFLTFSLGYMLYTYIKEKRSKKSIFMVIMVFWMMGMTAAITRAVRFALFLIIPAALFGGAGLVDCFKRFYRKYCKIEKPVLRYTILGITGFLIGSLICMFYLPAREKSAGIHPMLSDEVYKTLIELKEKTESSAVINSWWDYGDWYKTVADRSVIFDGHSQYKPISYWMGRAMCASDNDQALNILRMLNNTSYTLFEQIRDYFADEYDAAVFLSRVVSADENGFDMLAAQYGLSRGVRDKVKEAVFSQPEAPAYFIVDRSMVGKINAISFLGNWDFAKKYLISNLDKTPDFLIAQLVKKFGLKEKEAVQMLSEAVMLENRGERDEFPSLRYNLFRFDIKGQEHDGEVFFSNGAVLDLEKNTVRVYTERGFILASFSCIWQEGKMTLNVSEESDQKNGYLFYKDEQDTWLAQGMSDVRLLDSLFMRLFFMDGYGFDNFEPFIMNRKEGILVYKIKWKQ